MSEGEDYQDYDDYGGDEDYYDEGGDMEDDHQMHEEPPAQLLKKQSSVATHKNIEYLERNIVISRIEQCIDEVQNEQGISGGRALFLLRTCGYSLQESQNIPHKIMDDIYFSETKESTESKNNKQCLLCKKDLDENSFHLECNHRFCKPCTENYITEELKSQQGTKICSKCPFPSCKERFGYKDFQKLLNEQHFKEYQVFLENDAFSLANYIIKCPSKDCTIVILQLDQLSLKQVAKSIRCQCRTLFCSACGSNAHEPLKCSIVQTFNQLEKIHSQMKTLKEKEEFYFDNSQPEKYVRRNKFCPNGCLKFITPKADNPKLLQCPFCEGVFCIDCNELYPCSCKKEESKEEMEEEEVKKREKAVQAKNKIPLPKAINYLFPLTETFIACKNELIFVKVAKRKISNMLQSIINSSPDKAILQSEVNVIHSSLDALEDLILFIGHANILLQIGVSQKSDLLKFQLEDLNKILKQLKPLLTQDYEARYKTLKAQDIQQGQFQNYMEQVNRLSSQATKAQTSCASDFIGVSSTEDLFEQSFKSYQEDSTEALAKVKQEQERRDKQQKNIFSMGGDFRGPGGGRMHGYGGGDYDHHKYGHHNRGGQRGHDQYRGGQVDSDDDDDDQEEFNQRYQRHHQGQQNLMMTPQQSLMLFLNKIKIQYPDFFFEVSKAKTIEEANVIFTQLKKKNEPVYSSDSILLILPQGIRVNDRTYLVNLESENIKDNKILSEIINQHKQIFKAHDEKQKKINQVCLWNSTFLNYFEFLIQRECEKLGKQQDIIKNSCLICSKTLYPLNEPDFATKLLTQAQSISDNDVILLKGCPSHPVHLNCFKEKVTQESVYVCPCGVDFYKPFADSLKGVKMQATDYEYVEITYNIPHQQLKDMEIKSQKVVAYLVPFDEESQSIFQAYFEAYVRGLTFEVKEENGKFSLQFRILHNQQKPPRFSVLIKQDAEFSFELKKQLQSYQIKLD